MLGGKQCPGTGKGCLTVIPRDRALCHFCSRTAILIMLKDHVWTLRRAA